MPRVSDEEREMEQLNVNWTRVFQRFDRDGDGKVPLDEMRHLLLSSPLGNSIPPHVINQIVQRADKDLNGIINLQEFLDLIDENELEANMTWDQKLYFYSSSMVLPQSTRTQHRKWYHDHYSCCPPPIFMFLISMVELGIFIYYAVELGNVSANGPVPFKSPLIYSPRRRYEAWRFISYMFIHAGYVHITFNLLVQLILGVPLEMVHGWWRILLVYLSGVILGSLFTSVSDPYVYLAGASGGVYAILVAHLASIILNWSEMEFAPIRLVFFTVVIGTDIGVAIYNRYSGVETKVGYVAHLGGGIAGLLVGLNVLKNIRLLSWERILRWVSLALLLLIILTTVLINIFYKSHFPVQE